MILDHFYAFVWRYHFASGLTLAGGGFGQDEHPLGLFHFDALPELVAGNVQAHSETRKDRDAKIPLAGFDVSQRLPVDFRHLGQSFLSQVCGQSGLADVLSNQEQYLGVCHP